jgi:Uma2 family endonuclease
MVITDITQLDPLADYTYSDYLLWQFKERVELFRGKLRQMAAPSVKHQRLSSILSRAIGNHLEGQKCDVFTAPFDVRLPLPPHRITSEKTNTVVQPDLCVVCDRNKLDERGCIGAPELVVEILSPGNSKKEMKEKYELYESAGVLEYWVIDPEHFVVYSYGLHPETQLFVASRPLTDEDALTSAVLEGFSLDLSRIFTND